MMNTIGGLGLSANIMADKAQNKAQVEKAEGFAQELSKAEKNTMDDPAYYANDVEGNARYCTRECTIWRISWRKDFQGYAGYRNGGSHE